jgi:hypothetical protein
MVRLAKILDFRYEMVTNMDNADNVSSEVPDWVFTKLRGLLYLVVDDAIEDVSYYTGTIRNLS